jgi:hypothetical protein
MQGLPAETPSASAETRHTVSLAGLAFILLLVVASTIVVRKLQVRCLLEACLLSGKPGCEQALDRLRVSRQFERLWHLSTPYTQMNRSASHTENRRI